MADQDYDFKTVSAKVTQAEFSRFKDYCEKKGLKPSTQLKELIKAEINNPLPINLAGNSVFSYNKTKDNFSWKVLLDDGQKIEVEGDLSSEYVSQLFEAIKKAIEERNTYIKKDKKESVSIPSKILRKKNEIA